MKMVIFPYENSFLRQSNQVLLIFFSEIRDGGRGMEREMMDDDFLQWTSLLSGFGRM